MGVDFKREASELLGELSKAALQAVAAEQAAPSEDTPPPPPKRSRWESMERSEGVIPPAPPSQQLSGRENNPRTDGHHGPGQPGETRAEKAEGLPPPPDSDEAPSRDAGSQGPPKVAANGHATVTDGGHSGSMRDIADDEGRKAEAGRSVPERLEDALAGRHAVGSPVQGERAGTKSPSIFLEQANQLAHCDKQHQAPRKGSPDWSDLDLDVL